MLSNDKILNIALIPAYMPEMILVEITKQLSNSGFTIVIIDDGSGEKYKPIFDAVRKYAYVISYSENRGKGYALKIGFEYMLNRFGRSVVVVTLDADGQHRIPDVIKISKASENNPGKLILGSRKFSGKVPFKSKFGNSITRFVFSIAARTDVFDTQTGLRAFSGDMLSTLIGIKGERYEYEMNMLLEMSKLGNQIIEIPIDTVYINNNSSTHFNPVSDSAKIYKQILRFSASSIISFLCDFLVYSLLIFFGGGIILSNAAARLISGSINFTMNRKLVFKSKEKPIISAIKYIVLAAIILIGNTVLLSVFTNLLFMNKYVSKLVTELVFFILSFTIQKLFVFKNKEGDYH